MPSEHYRRWTARCCMLDVRCLFHIISIMSRHRSRMMTNVDVITVIIIRDVPIIGR